MNIYKTQNYNWHQPNIPTMSWSYDLNQNWVGEGMQREKHLNLRI